MAKKQNRLWDAFEKRGYVTLEEDENPPAFDASAFSDGDQASPESPTVILPPPPVYTEAAPAAEPVYTQPRSSESEQLAAFFSSGGSKTNPTVNNATMLPGVGEKMSERAYWENSPDPIPAPEPDRYMDIEELYRSFGMKTAGTDTVYLIEDYIKTLPESLPAELRRSIILKIVSASGFDFDKLLNDGIDRVSRLNDYSGSFAAHTDGIVKANMDEIAILERQIAQIQETINERKNLHKRQFLAIENEGQRLKEILDFITK